MRITRSYLFRMRLSITRLVSFGLLALLTLTAISVTSYFISPQRTASAVTPPDSCFAFNVGTGTITDYYDNEGNNGANPACTRDVDIPAMIGATSVTAIGDSAFSENQLNSVTIPNGVTSIGQYSFSSNLLDTVTIPNSILTIGSGAFYDNKLTSLTLGNSVTMIGGAAFSFNILTDVFIPDSVVSIEFDSFSTQNTWGRGMDWCEGDAPCFWSLDPSVVQSAFDNIWYVQLYTESPSNPNNLQDGVSHEFDRYGSDSNANGSDDSLGGHLINPSSFQLSYVDQVNANIQVTVTHTGHLGSFYLNNYFVTQGPTVPAPSDPENPTPEEQTAIDNALSAYYRIGDTVTISPPAIDGYITPATRSFVLGASTNNFSYVYASQNTGENTPISTSGGGDTGTLAQTGMSEWIVLAASALLLIVSIYPLLRRFA